MALSLGDIQKHSEKGRATRTELKERVLRPWETFDQRGLQTRTNQAQEAVKRAREIVEKNNLMVDRLREGHVNEEVVKNIEFSHEERMKRFEDEATEFIVAPIQVQKGKGLFSLIRDVFTP
ncbi:hypothetical protein M899_0765 [Bacteriovorax sp. BSW11_IV]|uniref:hypothetical protein n=1 Tax=Bacteriovorax sp. BSW11_IV TaxID=1353529 RepID=UPI000389FC72|nr:hypothetical protein [Bacteriovorax sp. BSW11_IV]EQC49128.1 hypothetical protein M899_0765 [Bacteriovorax sp. BSW11_IV]